MGNRQKRESERREGRRRDFEDKQAEQEMVLKGADFCTAYEILYYTPGSGLDFGHRYKFT